MELYWLYGANGNQHQFILKASNFGRDQVGMRNQLRRLELLIKVIDPPLYRHLELTDSANMFCCFRWLLILFKREFFFEDIKMLWEAIWSCPLTRHFQLFVAVAILNEKRQELFACKAFDEALKLINSMSQGIMIPEMIQHAEVMYYIFRDRMIASAPKDTGTALDIALKSTNRIENQLGLISGIPHSEILLDHGSASFGMHRISLDDFNELAELLEMEIIAT